jgi:soluble lytic murein transglycosylase
MKPALRAPLRTLGLNATLSAAIAVGAVLLGASAHASAPTARSTGPAAEAGALRSGNERVQQARDALRRNQSTALAAHRDALLASGHPLAPWVDYWELTHRLARAEQRDLDAFYARWPGSYQEDRLRNDWLLELGKRRDWTNFRREFPRFRMNDDRQVTCYALLVRHLDGEKVHDEALAAWLAQRDADNGCTLMATTLAAAGVFTEAELFAETRRAVEAGRERAARTAAELYSAGAATRVTQLWENPQRVLDQLAPQNNDLATEIALWSLLRMATRDPAAAAAQLESQWQRRLKPADAALAWGVVAKHAAIRLQPEAAEHVRRAWRYARNAPGGGEAVFTDDLLAWQVRAALRQPTAADRWTLVQRATGSMSPAGQREPSWVYWGARAELALHRLGRDSEERRLAAMERLAGIASPLSFYGKLAQEEIGEPVRMPPAPRPLDAAERAAAASHPGLSRALAMFALGLRSEAVREWNFSLRGMGERELLAAAQRACEREIWDRCINTSERTRQEIDLAQRFPTPFRNAVVAQADAIGLDPAYMYGLIRQESRFIMDARSHVGASGLMQLMPATARWTARRIGLEFTPTQINDRDVNLLLGASYLKIVLDDFGGQALLAAAAYNAGPGRPRRWREGPEMEPAAWAETIPFSETRDYVQRVLSNAVVYSAVMGRPSPTLSARLGPAVGPRAAAAPQPDARIP